MLALQINEDGVFYQIDNHCCWIYFSDTPEILADVLGIEPKILGKPVMEYALEHYDEVMREMRELKLKNDL